MKERIGILGGSFDPVHNGHIALAEECLHQLKLDKVVFVPAHTSPFKRESGAASCEDRLQMLRLALKKEEGLELSTYEIDKGGVSYSVETVSHFRKTYGDEAELFFISGADSSKDLSEWKDIEKLLFLCTFVIATRPGWGENSPYEEKIKRIMIPSVDVSSSLVRERAKNSKSIDKLVPREVAAYIKEKALYRNT